MRRLKVLALLCLALMVVLPGVRGGSAEAPRTYVFTGETGPPRDYRAPDPLVPVDPAILPADAPWAPAGEGMKRKVFFNDRLTMVLLRIDRPVKAAEAVTCHYHVHDQATYVMEGKLRVKVGGSTREIGRGGCYIVPSNVPHGIVPLTRRVTILDVFTPTREDFRPASR